MIRIITDSTASITKEEGEKLNIDIVPLYVLMANKMYRDRVDFTDEEFYELLEDNQPTTSQPNPSDFLDVYNKYPDDDILCITLSKKLSGTYQSANMAKDMSENKKIRVIDSETVSLALRSLILVATEMRDKGHSLNEIVDKIEELKGKTVTLGMADTLENLKRGGRISNIKFITGSLLNIKPLLIVEDGILQSYSKKARGKQKAIKIIAKALDKYNYDASKPITLGYAYDIENAKLLSNELEKYGATVSENDYFELGSVIATHTGKNAFIISFFSK